MIIGDPFQTDKHLPLLRVGVLEQFVRRLIPVPVHETQPFWNSLSDLELFKSWLLECLSGVQWFLSCQRIQNPKHNQHVCTSGMTHIFKAVSH